MVRWPVLISLVVLLARLGGELAGLGAPWFSPAPGGGFAVVGMGWLIPIFGFWFGWKLTGAGRAPDRPGFSFLLHAAAAIFGVGGFVVAVAVLEAEFPVTQAVAGGGLLLAILLAWKAWPSLTRATLLYALLVRLAVVVVTIPTWYYEAGTHFDQVAEEFAERSKNDQLLVLITPQLTLWIGLTIGVAGLLATAASMIRGRSPDDAPDYE